MNCDDWSAGISCKCKQGITFWNIGFGKRKGDVYIVKPAKGRSSTGKRAKGIDKTSLSVKGMLAD